MIRRVQTFQSTSCCNTTDPFQLRTVTWARESFLLTFLAEGTFKITANAPTVTSFTAYLVSVSNAPLKLMMNHVATFRWIFMLLRGRHPRNGINEAPAGEERGRYIMYLLPLRSSRSVPV